MFGLDTNIVIYAVNRRRPAVAARLEAALAVGMRLWISTVTLFELEFGIARSDRAAQSAAVLAEFLTAGIEIVPFDAEDAHHAGAIRTDLEHLGTPIGAYDLLIAAQARRRVGAAPGWSPGTPANSGVCPALSWRTGQREHCWHQGRVAASARCTPPGRRLVSAAPREIAYDHRHLLPA